MALRGWSLWLSSNWSAKLEWVKTNDCPQYPAAVGWMRARPSNTFSVTSHPPLRTLTVPPSYTSVLWQDAVATGGGYRRRGDVRWAGTDRSSTHHPTRPRSFAGARTRPSLCRLCAAAATWRALRQIRTAAWARSPQGAALQRGPACRQWRWQWLAAAAAVVGRCRVPTC